MALTGKMFVKCRLDPQFLDLRKPLHYRFLRCYSEATPESNFRETPIFTSLKIKPVQAQPKKQRKLMQLKELIPRTKKMSVDQDWTNVWPGPKTFHPASVPLPLKQGCAINKEGPLSKDCNLELMKIPNFLHLTPPAIEKHCKALERFCTKWPGKSKEEMDSLFPIQIISTDYCFSGPVIRYPSSRIITLKFNLNALKLDAHALDKFLRLVGERYDPVTNMVTIVAESCPLKKQNYQYAHYLLTALYFESWKTENWEEKSDCDMEKYYFENRKSYKNLENVFKYNNQKFPKLKNLKEFKEAVEAWHDKGDNKKTISNYKKGVLQLLKLPNLNANTDTTLCEN